MHFFVVLPLVALGGRQLFSHTDNSDKRCFKDAFQDSSECIFDACTAYADYHDLLSQVDRVFVILSTGESEAKVPFSLETSSTNFDEIVAKATAEFQVENIQGFFYSFPPNYSGPYQVGNQGDLRTAIDFAKAVGEILELQIQGDSEIIVDNTSLSDYVDTQVAAFVTPRTWDSQYSLTLNPDDVEDLGTTIKEIYDTRAERFLAITLASGDYHWNRYFAIGQRRMFTLTGAGYRNGAHDISVNILMDQFIDEEHIYEHSARPGQQFHDPSRLYCADDTRCTIQGVNIIDSSFDDTVTASPPTPSKKALFIVGDLTKFTLHQSRMQVSNDVINVTGYSYARVRMGWLYVDRHTSYPANRENPRIITSDSGWNFGGNGANVSCTHTYPGTTVSLQSDDSDIFFNCN